MSFQEGNSRPILAYVNGKGEPKKIDVNRCVDELTNGDLNSMYSTQRDIHDFIHAAPRVPMAPITFQFLFDPNELESNFVNRQPIQFCYQNVYKDGSKSAISPYSDLAIPDGILSLGGASLASKSIENVCQLQIPAQGPEVRFLNLIFREGNDGVPFLFDKIENSPTQENLNFNYIGSESILGFYNFKNDKTGVVLDETDRFKTFDNVPRDVYAQELIDDRVVYGNYKEGYPNLNVNVQTEVILNDAPPPGYTFEVDALPYLFREKKDYVSFSTNGTTNLDTLVTNSGFVLDMGSVPDVILPGEYKITINIIPTQNYHAYVGAGDRSHTPENIPSNWQSYPVYNSQANTVVGHENPNTTLGIYGSSQTGFLSANHWNQAPHAGSARFNTTTFSNAPAGGAKWLGEDEDNQNGCGTSAVNPVIFKGEPITIVVQLRVSSECSKSIFEESVAHVIYGLPFDTSPLEAQNFGLVLQPTSQEQAAFYEADIDLGLTNKESFDHETSERSDLIFKWRRGGWMIVNKAKLRFFFETGSNCKGVTGAQANIDTSSGDKSGYAFKMCLAHAVNAEIMTCIPQPAAGFGSFVNPTDIEGDGYLPDLASQPALSGGTVGDTNAQAVRRSILGGKSRYDIMEDGAGGYVCVWPDQVNNFAPEVTTGPKYGPSMRSLAPVAAIGQGYNIYSSSGPYSRPPVDSGVQNPAWFPAPIGRWSVFTELKNLYTDADWANSSLGILSPGFEVKASRDVYPNTNNTDQATLLVVGNPGRFGGPGGATDFYNCVGQVENNASFVSGGQSYCLLALNKGYSVPSGSNIDDLVAGEVNKISLVDGDSGPGGMGGYAYKMFQEDNKSWDYGGSQSSYTGALMNGLASSNSRGSWTNLDLIGGINGMPHLQGSSVVFNKITQSNAQPFLVPIAPGTFSGVPTVGGFVQRTFARVQIPDFQPTEYPSTAVSYGIDSYSFSDDFIPFAASEGTANSNNKVFWSQMSPSASSYNPAAPSTFFVREEREVLEPAPISSGGSARTPFTNVATSIGTVGTESFKTGATHEFGLVYYDEKGRHGAVQPIDAVYVPGYSQQERPSGKLGSVKIKFSILSAPPSWAKSYRIVYAGNNSIREFIQYSTYDAYLRNEAYDPDNPQVFGADTGEQARIYVPLNYLQASDVSYAESYGAVSQDDGTKELYRFAPGDYLTVLYYSSESGSRIMVPKPYRFRILSKEIYDVDQSPHPLFPDGGSPSEFIQRSGEFLVLEDNPLANGFSVADIAGNTDKWRNRVIFEISRPRGELNDEVRPYYETNYGGQILPNGDHQYNPIEMSKGDVFYRQVPVHVNQTLNGNFVPNIAGPVDNPTRFFASFQPYFLETEGITDLYKSNARSIGRAHFVDSNASEYERISSLTFSEKTFSGSADLNYFSFPQIGNFKDLSLHNGPIERLYSDNVILTSYQRSRTAFLPISRDVLQTGTTDQIVTSSKVLGTATEIDSHYAINGHPESLVVIDGDHFFFDKQTRKIVMLRGGKTPIVISDFKVDSYVKTVTDSWLDDEWFAFLGHDPDREELLFCLVTEDAAKNQKGGGDLVGTLAFDLKGKKSWKTRYSYLSQFFSKVGGKLVSFWRKPSGSIPFPWMFTSNPASKNYFMGEGPFPTTFTAVMNTSPHEAKEFVMLSAASDKVVDAKVVTDQKDSENTSSFKVWKDYDGVKYAEVPKKVQSVSEAGKTQKQKWLPTYPAVAASVVPNVSFKKSSDGTNVDKILVSVKIPLTHAIWRSPIPQGPKSKLFEKLVIENEYYPCGAHPLSDISYDREVKIRSTKKSDDGVNGVITFEMSGSVFSEAVSSLSFSVGYVDTADEEGEKTAIATSLVPLVTALGGISAGETYDLDFGSDEWSDYQKLTYARLFILPILSCTGISANSAALQKVFDGELPLWNPADLNNDGIVNTNDLLILLNDFGDSGAGLIGDIVDGEVGGVIGLSDGTVDTADFLALISQYGQELVQGCTNPTATNYNPAANFDDGSCVFPGGGGDEGTDDGGGSDPADVNLFYIANGSQNKQIFSRYVDQLDGVHMKGKYMTIDISSSPSGDGKELNLESLMVDFNGLTKNYTLGPTRRK